jgi:hypothetical protein
VHWIARRTWRRISRINDTLGKDTLGHGYLVQNHAWLERRSFCSADLSLPLMSDPLVK